MKLEPPTIPVVAILSATRCHAALQLPTLFQFALSLGRRPRGGVLDQPFVRSGDIVLQYTNMMYACIWEDHSRHAVGLCCNASYSMQHKASFALKSSLSQSTMTTCTVSSPAWRTYNVIQMKDHSGIERICCFAQTTSTTFLSSCSLVLSNLELH